MNDYERMISFITPQGNERNTLDGNHVQQMIEFKSKDSTTHKEKNTFDTKLPDIPLDIVFDQRSKIKSMILDIKTNIYKMDKY